MPQDAFTIKYVAAELSQKLAGGKITKIIQPEKELVIFFIYTASGTVKLEICLAAKGCRMSITERDVTAPKVAPNFCMLLRKYITGAKILSVNSVEGERVVYMDLECITEFEHTSARLYAELMGKYSNAVLTERETVVGALKTAAIGENTERALFCGVKYAPPKPQDKTDPNSLAELEKLFESAHGDRAKFIADNVRGIAYTTACDMVAQFGENINANNVNAYICAGQYAPCLTYEDGKPADFKVRACFGEQKRYQTLLQAQTAYYDCVTQKAIFESAQRRLLSAVASAVKKAEKRLAVQSEKLLECKDAELIKLKGELITANIYAVERGADSFEAVNYYDENGGKIKIALDRTLSPADNAQRYYKKYAKLKRTIASVSTQKQQTQAQLDYLNSINAHICAAECLCDLKETQEELAEAGLTKAEVSGKKKQPEITPFREFRCENFKIICGRNNLQNDRLLKSVSQNDIWLHTRGYHSSHVVIVTDGKTVPDGVLLAASEICAYYSEGRMASKVTVDYCLKKFVKKPPKAPSGFVIYTDYKTILVSGNGHAELSTEQK